MNPHCIQPCPLTLTLLLQLMREIEGGRAIVTSQLEKHEALKRSIEALEKEIAMLRSVIREKVGFMNLLAIGCNSLPAESTMGPHYL